MIEEEQKLEKSKSNAYSIQHFSKKQLVRIQRYKKKYVKKTKPKRECFSRPPPSKKKHKPFMSEKTANQPTNQPRKKNPTLILSPNLYS